MDINIHKLNPTTDISLLLVVMSLIAQSVFNVLKACNITSLRVMEGSCPKCEPLNSDQWCRDFFEACLQRVVDMLLIV